MVPRHLHRYRTSGCSFLNSDEENGVRGWVADLNGSRNRAIHIRKMVLSDVRGKEAFSLILSTEPNLILSQGAILYEIKKLPLQERVNNFKMMSG